MSQTLFQKAVSGNLQALFLFLAFLGAELHFSASAEAEAPALGLVPRQLSGTAHPSLLFPPLVSLDVSYCSFPGVLSLEESQVQAPLPPSVVGLSEAQPLSRQSGTQPLFRPAQPSLRHPRMP